MIGCLILGGLAGLLALKLWHHRRHGWVGCGPRGFRGWHHHRDPDGWDPWEPPPWGRTGHRGGGVQFLAQRIGATPEQSREMADAMDAFVEEVRGAREEGKRTRSDLASALRRPVFDEVLFGELFARHDDVMEKIRKAFVGLSARVHQTLTEEQRERMASLLERGQGFFPGGGGWPGAAW